MRVSNGARRHRRLAAIRDAAIHHCINVQTVTGYVIDINVNERRFTVKLPATDKRVECHFRDGLVTDVLENRRQLVQVTGNVVYDTDGETPKKMSDVDDVSVLDLSDIRLTSFSIGDNTEKELKEPLVLTPKLTESCQYITAEKPEWGIDAIAQTREELLEEIRAEFWMQWNHCAVLPDEKLGRAFREQKRNLLAAVK
jgi:hypothetical protein